MDDGSPIPGLSQDQRLLLTIILADEATAVAAWERLRPRFSLDAIEPGSFQVMPMLAERLVGLNMAHRDLPRLRGMRRQASWRARLAAHDAAQFVSALHSIRTPHMALDGPPLSPLLYGAGWRRPVTGLEVVVPADRLPAACKALAAHNWSARTRFGALRARGHRSVHWQSRSGLPCTLRPDLPPDLLKEPLVDRDKTWLASTPVEISDVRIDLPAPVDVVSHLSLARKRAAPDRRCLWVVDVAMALEHPALDRVELQRRLGRSRPDGSLHTALRMLAGVGVATADVLRAGAAL